jgi:predicted nucleic acid-binding protein
VKVLFDTSVLVAALVEAHPMHARALPWLQRAKAGEIAMVVVSHSVAELTLVQIRS